MKRTLQLSSIPLTLLVFNLFLLLVACSSPEKPRQDEFSGIPSGDISGSYSRLVQEYLGETEIILNSSILRFPETEINLLQSKVFDHENLNIRNIYLDAETGDLVDPIQIRNTNEAMWRDEYGALHFTLKESLSEQAMQDEIEVIAWVKTPPLEPFNTDVNTAEDWRIAHANYVASRKNILQTFVNSALSELESSGATIVDKNSDPPIIHLRSTRSLLESKLAFLPSIELLIEKEKPELLAARAAQDQIQEPLWPAHKAGMGRDLLIAVIEPNACIHRGHSAFREIQFINPPSGRCEYPNLHSTGVAGMLASIKGENPILEGNDLIGLFAGKLMESEVINDWVIETSPHFINLSAESFSSFQSFIDYIIYTHRIFIAQASGNSQRYANLCSAYNVLCVGGYRHWDTIGDFSDDTHLGGSWENSSLTGREEPDLVGVYSASLPVGMSDHDIESSAWQPASGTSYSTASVLGFAALLTANFPSELTGNPTLLRAIMLASASHKVQISDIDNTALRVPSMTDDIDDRTGAGVPRGDRAQSIINANRFFSGYLDRNSDFDNSGRLKEQISFSALPGDWVRVAVTWENCPSHIPFTVDPLLVDIDLSIIPPQEELQQIMDGISNPRVNPSFVDNYELISFPVYTEGEYKISLQAPHWETCPLDNEQKTFIAVAWDIIRVSPKNLCSAEKDRLNDLLDSEPICNPANAYFEECVEDWIEWHSQNDTEVEQLQEKLSSPECQ